MRTFEQIVQESHERYLQGLARELKIELSEQSVRQFNRQVELIKTLLNHGYRASEAPRITITEALQSADASILFPRAIADTLMRGREPMMIGQTVLAKTIQVDNVRSFEFPVVGALRAFDIGETQEYPEQSPAFSRNYIEIKVTKSGLAFAISEEIIRDSMWDVLGYMIEAAGYALMRHKEQKIFKEAIDKAHPVYDNSVNDQNFWTHGMGADGKYNYTVHFDDLIDALGALVAHEYVPTDIVMHPLSWVVLAKDPILRAQFLHGGQIGQTVWRNMPTFDQSANLPWAINYVVTPFMPIKLRTKLTGHSGGGATSPWPNPQNLPDANISDILIVDRNNGILILQREPMSMDDFEDWRRDATMMKFKERYGVAALNQGRGMTVIKNVRLDTNYAPVITVRQVSPP